MERVRFYQLPRSIQDRFVVAASGLDEPRPLLLRRSNRPFPVLWFSVAVVGLLLFGGLLRLGYGSLSSGFALVSIPVLAGYAGALVVGLFGTLHATASYLEALRSPFLRGIFVFPSSLIDATSDEFRVYPLSELSRVEPSGKSVTLHFRGERFALQCNDGSAAEQAERSLEEARAVYAGAEATGDEREQARFNPLLEPHFANPLAPVLPLSAPVPAWRRSIPVLAVAIGALLGFGVGLVRNKWSGEAMYAAARAADTPAAYRAYLEQGGDRSDVAEVLLPSAELADLVEDGSLEDLERYAHRNPGSRIRPAIDAALRTGLLEALKQAQAAGTITALDEFKRAHSVHVLVAPELAAARKAVMDRLLKQYLDESASEQNEELGPFMRRVFAFLLEHGPTVEVRFHRVVPDTVARADKIVRADRYFAKVMLPSQYFDEKRSREREARIFDALDRRFSSAFPEDAFSLKLGRPIGPGEEIPEQAEVPTLYLTHSTNMGGGIPNINPHGTFVGVGFLFKAQFATPGRKKRLAMKFSTWRPPELLKLRKRKITIPKVYLSMAESAFAGFEEKLVSWLFRE